MATLSSGTRVLRASARRLHHSTHDRTITSSQHLRNTLSNTPPSPKKIKVPALLSTPTWDPSTLLPSPSTDIPSELTPSKLRHLLRLSALPPPSSPEAEASLLSTLAQQLHFVRQIQKVDTTGVEPLRAIRDETAAAVEEGMVESRKLRRSLEKEEVRGTYAPRRRRRREEVGKRSAGEEGEWDVLGNAERRVGRYFVVEKEKV
ncbi:putative Glu-tRNAGln amidotransferase C subunit [Elsinoe australis]|uniref:Putative Glu-tRNAGln amidotransferase C subunit n=1 Tax=Elsinoe australis TaxID=40998 RepID=A0A4U7B6S3_9PEZI|nr:putative Glu-tRNAGln amidotransferase C subunit [Elsinoe australis]